MILYLNLVQPTLISLVWIKLVKFYIFPILGKYSSAGCTIEFFLDWAWNRVASIKQKVDKETVLLFDYSCLEVPDTVRLTLVLQDRQLKHLQILFDEAKHLWRSGTIEIVENKCNIIHLVRLFLKS